ncbi:hypothetical protein DB313_05615 (plasmid) [Borrelia turcica IST7]|uniref:Uncharacterized protein n=1 Tax=Borrelia turcica IST7 TaxID=1104446 RepID=A0A386PN99_9SPIR|nr:DUF685 domain-containing protein [Borrelia turcica]AYE36976.1 hypothetical protein DB313_05615 [Borrelia turcica IST7]
MSQHIDTDNEIQIKDLNKKSKAEPNDLLLLDDPLTSCNAITYKNFYEQIREATYKDLPKLIEYLEKIDTIQDLKEDTSLEEINLNRGNIPTGRKEIIFYLDYSTKKIIPITLKTFAYKIYKHLFGVASQQDSDKTAVSNATQANDWKDDDLVTLLRRENGTLFKATYRDFFKKVKGELINTATKDTAINSNEDNICFYEKDKNRISITTFKRLVDAIISHYTTNENNIDTSYEKITFFDSKNYKFNAYNIDSLKKALDLATYETKANANAKYETKENANKTYVKKSYANSEYETKANVNNHYLKKTDASSVYETKANATKTYLPKASALVVYETKDNANNTYVKKSDASSVYETKANVNNTYVKKSEGITNGNLKLRLKDTFKNTYKASSITSTHQFILRNTSDNDIEILDFPVWLQGAPDDFGGTRTLNNDSHTNEGEYGKTHITLKLETRNETEIRIPQRFKNNSDAYIYLKISVQPIFYSSRGEKDNVKRVFVKFNDESAKREVFQFDAWGQKAHYSDGSYVGHIFPLYNGWYKIITLSDNTLDLIQV